MKHQTRSFEASAGIESKDKSLGEKEQKILNAFMEGDFGCYRSSVAKLIEALTGFDVVPHLERKNVYILPMAVVKVADNPNTHPYPVNEAVISAEFPLCEERRAYALDMEMGNSLPATHRAKYLPVTDEEIVALATAYYNKYVVKPETEPEESDAEDNEDE